MADDIHVELVETPSTLAGQLCQAFTANGTLVELPFADAGYMTCKPTFFAAPSDGALYALAWAVSVVFTSEGDWGSYEEQVFLLRFPCGADGSPDFAAGQLVARQDAGTMAHFAYVGDIVDCRGLELDGRIWLAWLAKDGSWQVWRLKQPNNDDDDDDEPFEVLASGRTDQSAALSVDAEQATVTIQNNVVQLWSLC